MASNQSERHASLLGLTSLCLILIFDSFRHWHNTSLWPSLPLLHLSSLGIGTYLGEPDSDTDEQMESAIVYSVYRGGWNVIDTASNYRYGRSEVSVGLALDSLLSGNSVSEFFHEPSWLSTSPPLLPQNSAVNGQPIVQQAQSHKQEGAMTGRSLRFDLTRDMLFVSTKAGFMDTGLLHELLSSNTISKRDVVHGHCMHPACLEASLNLSLQRLNLETVDLLYLHNAAEMQLQALGREVFMQRLLAAFEFLEKAKAEGTIRHYGLATWNCFRVPPSDPSYLPLSEVLKIAEVAAQGTSGHALQYLQLPINPVMNEAFSQKGWQGEEGAETTLLEAGNRLGVAFYSSAPMMEAELLQGKGVGGIRTGALDSIVELDGRDEEHDVMGSTAAKLLQLARSTPRVVSTLVGHKTREHVESNVKVSLVPDLSEDAFWTIQAKLEKRRQVLRKAKS